MKSLKCKGLLMAAALLGSIFTAQAAPAYPGLIYRTQPDGTQIKVRLMGDEFHSVMLTDDGYLVKEKDNALYFADVDANGIVRASSILARPIEKRDPAAVAYLNNIDMQGRVMPLLQKRGDALRAKAANRVSTTPQGMLKSLGVGLMPQITYPTIGRQKAIVILVEYADVKFKVENPADYFTRLINEPGFNDLGADGSVTDWFRANSGDQFIPEFDVYGPVQLLEDRAYYGAPTEDGRDDCAAHKMIIDACKRLDPKVDFSQYDCDGDGKIDNVFVFYAGEGQNQGATADAVWPHAWNITFAEPASQPYMFDGVQLDHYGCTNEWVTRQTGPTERLDRPDGIGTFCHEFSHILGLPDLYTTQYNTGCFTPGAWTTMDAGLYLNESMTPPYFTAFERQALGWLRPMKLTEPADIRLLPIQENYACMIPSGSQEEFFLIENRQKTGWDRFIPGHGMLVWHIYYEYNTWYNNACNNTPYMQCIDIEEADGLQTDASRAGDAFPGTAGVTSFTDDTTPSMLTWENRRLNTPITDIREANGIITFKVKNGAVKITRPEVKIDDVYANGATVSWNGNIYATYYLINVTDANGNYVGNYQRYNVGPATSIELEGLEPGSRYTVTVVGASSYYESTESQPVAVATPQASFDNLRAQAAEATDVAENSFTANWLPFDGATRYELNVYTKTYGEPNIDKTGFDGSLPAGWDTTSDVTYTISSYAGEAAPSMRFSDPGVYVETATYTDDVRSISFWSRGANGKGKCSLQVLGKIDGQWTLLEEFIPTDKSGGETLSVSNIPYGVRSVRVTFMREAGSTGSLAIDDLTIGWGGPTTPEYVSGFKAYDAATAQSATVNGLNTATRYFYTVTAYDASGKASKPSLEMTVRTTGVSGINTLDTDTDATLAVSVVAPLTIRVSGACGPITVTTPDGRTIITTKANHASELTLPAAGIYFISDTRATRKVAVR